jgi:hypothetical protein
MNSKDPKQKLSKTLKGINFLKKVNSKLDNVNSKLERFRSEIKKV